MLEHPTARLQDPARSARVGETLRALSDARGFGWIALTEDESFAEAAGGTRLTLNAATGDLRAGQGLAPLVLVTCCRPGLQARHARRA